MRGDSIRDLYAKSLALLGLALLGAIGAVVDYWPAALTVPATVAIDLGTAALRPLSAIADAVEPMLLATSRTSVVVTGQATSSSASTSAAAIDAVPVTQPEPVPVPSFELAMQAPGEFTGIPAPPIDLSSFDEPLETFRLTTIAPDPAATAPRSWVASITSPIVGGASKAGAAIGDGLTTVGSAVGSALNSFRKRLPFFQSGSSVGLTSSPRPQ